LGLNEPFVLGHSMGGKTAMQLALLHPASVRKLVVVDIAPRAYSPRHLKLILGMRSLDLSRFERRSDIDAALAPAVPDKSTRQFLLKNVARSDSGKFEWRMGLKEIHDNHSLLTQEIQPAPPFGSPALFLRGENSDFLLETDLELIKTLFPAARLETIPGAGHLIHVEQPDRFLEVVTAFLNEP
ncbi:MAG TPA: alpha/beta fold hydrolase, partial [Verrucomicrobiae bacterium]|nr:alpha/beta fold hydrolase [Verrucomicrobiae bacterium]